MAQQADESLTAVFAGGSDPEVLADGRSLALLTSELDPIMRTYLRPSTLLAYSSYAKT